MDIYKELKEKLYKTISDIEVWHEVLREIITLTGGKKAILMLRDRHSSDLYIPKDVAISLASPVLYGLSEQEINDYVEHYRHFDPWTKIEAAIPPLTPYALSSYVGHHELRASPFWSWLEPQNINDTVVLAIHYAADHWVGLNIFYDQQDLGVKTRLLALLSELQPLMNEVWEAGIKVRSVNAYPASIQFFLDQLSQPAVLVNHLAQVIKTNQRAHDLLHCAHERFSIKHGQLHYKESKSRDTLRQAIVDIAQETYHPDAPPKRQLRLPGHALTITLLNGGEDLIGHDTALRLITIDSMHSTLSKSQAPIWQHSSLTKREAELVKVLAEGGKIVDFIHHYGIAKSTAHAHWGNVKKKLNVRDRSEIYATHQLFIEKQPTR